MLWLKLWSPMSSFLNFSLLLHLILLKSAVLSPLLCASVHKIGLVLARSCSWYWFKRIHVAEGKDASISALILFTVWDLAGAGRGLLWDLTIAERHTGACILTLEEVWPLPFKLKGSKVLDGCIWCLRWDEWRLVPRWLEAGGWSAAHPYLRWVIGKGFLPGLRYSCPARRHLLITRSLASWNWYI